MTGVVRLALGGFFLFRLQRILCGVGATVLALGLAATALGGPGPPLIVLGLMFVQLPALVAAAVALREISAAKARNLAPVFRARMLASLALVAAIVVATWLLVMSLAPGTGATLAAAVIRPFVLASALLLGTFVATGSPGGALAVFGAGGLLVVWHSRGGYTRLVEAGIDPFMLAAAGAGIAWAVFARWYLATPHVRRASWNVQGLDRFQDARDTGWEGRLTRARAATSCLMGVLFVPDVRREIVKAAVALSILVVCLWFLFSWFPERAMWHAYVSGVIGPITFAAVRSANFARRARLLWLVGGPRKELFATCERRSLSFLAILIAVTLAIVLTAALQLTQPLGAAELVLLLLAVGSTGVFWTYFGLMFVEGWRPVDIALTALFCGTYLVFVAASLTTQHLSALVAVVTVQVAGAVLCRAIARRRWQRIDWLRLRPIRWMNPRVPAPR